MKEYQTPSIELLELSECDVMTASNGTPFLPYDWFVDSTSEQEL